LLDGDEERLEPVPTPPNIHFKAFVTTDPRVFEQTLLRSYEGTLDCPELNGVRAIEEIMAGHQSQGKHDPQRWWLLYQNGNPVGVLLLTEILEWNSLDISYLGVVPEARGAGLGRLLAGKSLVEARAANTSQVTLAVDSRNHPALHLYRSLGFEPHEQRAVFLRF
jgi:mycothiol synthase